MKYKGFYVKITPDTDLHREDKDGNDIRCEEAEQFAMDYIDCEEKEYCRMIDEFNKN